MPDEACRLAKVEQRIDALEEVFEDDKEYLFKNLDIRVPVKSEKELTSEDWNIVCEGKLSIDRKTSTAIIKVINEQTT